MRRLLPSFVFLAAAIGVWGVGSRSFGATGVDPLPEAFAESHGLTRGWFAQMQIDPTQGRLKEVVLDRGTLFALSDQSVVSAVDAATGAIRWTAEVGNRKYPSFAPTVNRRFVVVINGTSLYVLNRANGQLLWKTQLQSVPGASAAASQWRIYVPLLDGRLVCYRMRPEKDSVAAAGAAADVALTQPGEVPGLDSLRLEQAVPPPLSLTSPGRAIMQPLVLRQNEYEEAVVWPTDKGYLCCARMNLKDEKSLDLAYRLQTDGPISSPPCYLPPDANVLPDSGLLVATSEDGYVYAIRERNGQQLWRFSTGEPIIESPVILGRYIFATNQLGGMYCLDAKSGGQVWWTPEVTRFLAASKERIYATDKYGQLHVLSAKTGAQLDTIAANTLPIKLTNTQNDRLFLANRTGMLQCFYEPELAAEPLARSTPVKDVETAKTATKEPTAEQPPSDTPKPAPSAKPSSGGSSSPKSSSKPKATPKKKSAGDVGTSGTTPKKGRKAKGGPGMMPTGMPGMMPGMPGAGVRPPGG
jgi:hypothetical protein